MVNPSSHTSSGLSIIIKQHLFQKMPLAFTWLKLKYLALREILEERPDALKSSGGEQANLGIVWSHKI